MVLFGGKDLECSCRRICLSDLGLSHWSCVGHFLLLIREWDAHKTAWLVCWGDQICLTELALLDGACLWLILNLGRSSWLNSGSWRLQYVV